ncbi:hypothetical protein RJ639_017994 [Escallonia herrerae]|uniref:Glycoside hydrolase family 28 n=1 Tax=Escallonia herrerae TaxID=1293975 RepID=A0AA89AIR7_9ASTE|nr:hypothetical protein RJ639_017994 [Escallonia herrerae]
MASRLAFGSLCLSMVFMLACISDARRRLPERFFNVRAFGAVPDGRTDNTKAFLRAWDVACRWRGPSRVYVPFGTFMVGSVKFKGPCDGPIALVIKGDLKAPTDPRSFSNMRFDFVSNSKVNHIRSIDSKNAHFNLFACTNMNMSHIRIITPSWAPNTDGIHIGSSSNIQISHSIIGTGDDCIAMVSGSQDIDISDVICGPGHGISIGSLGRGQIDSVVTGVAVSNCTFVGTQNGIRIKTWAPSSAGLASGFTFEDINMNRVNNPIFIDQQYCPHPPCNHQASSRIQVSNVTMRNIWGISTSKAAVTMNCSGSVPCKQITLANINLAYRGPGGPAISACSNVRGKAYGQQLPPGCL